MTETNKNKERLKLAPEAILDSFKFYEEAADKTKNHAWAQTTWVLSFNAVILGFSAELYLEHSNVRGFLIIEWIVVLAGVVLCGYLLYVLGELGKHIRHHLTAANQLASTFKPLFYS